jgi:hypothetical protein
LKEAEEIVVSSVVQHWKTHMHKKIRKIPATRNQLYAVFLQYYLPLDVATISKRGA